MKTNNQTLYCNGSPIHMGMAIQRALAQLPGRVYLITDENVERLHGYLTVGIPRIVLRPGEETKSLETVDAVCRQLVHLGADRGAHLLGVGGGVVCDITGLVASLFMRGIGFSLAPTTLLAQVDAAIGGKTGVNSGPYKNLIGTFAKPSVVFCDPHFLTTLPDEELSNGLAECIKHACIADAELFASVEDEMEKMRGRDMEALNRLIVSSVRIKTEIVNQDPKENDLRKLLNFGHTFGHAIEKHCGLAHGQAVSLGMCIANDLATRSGHLSDTDAQRIRALLTRAGLPVKTDKLDMTALRKLLVGDKKRSGDQVSFVLLRRIGKAFIHPMAIND